MDRRVCCRTSTLWSALWLAVWLGGAIVASAQPPWNESSQLPDATVNLNADKMLAVCFSAKTAEVSGLHFAKSGGASSCGEQVADVQADLASQQFRSACAARWGGGLPDNVLSVSATCREDTAHYVVDATVCCPNPCDGLDTDACGSQSVCTWDGRCETGNGSLTCRDLGSRPACDRYSGKCDWRPAECKKRPTQVRPFECNDLNAEDCAQQSECSMRTECRRRSGSLTCRDLDKNQCSRYGKWCRWKRGKCRKRTFAGPFECRDLTPGDCQVEGECYLRTSCRRRSGSLTCNDLTADQCPRYAKWCEWEPKRCTETWWGWLTGRLACEELEPVDCVEQGECSWSGTCRYTG